MSVGILQHRGDVITFLKKNKDSIVITVFSIATEKGARVASCDLSTNSIEIVEKIRILRKEDDIDVDDVYPVDKYGIIPRSIYCRDNDYFYVSFKRDIEINTLLKSLKSIFGDLEISKISD